MTQNSASSSVQAAGVTLQQIGQRFAELRDAAATGGFVSEADAAADLEHLRVALQAAVTLEFATLPPYLSALWSVRDEVGYVAKSIRQIVQEEMLHLALAANMLVSIGGHPQIATVVPAYPGQLPLGVHPELTVQLAGLSHATLETFLEIERPHHPGHHIALAAAKDFEQFHRDEDPDDKPDYTIGEFYDDILASFKRLNPTMSPDRQITAPLSTMVITSVDDVAKAIAIIERQGEGSEGPPDTGPYNLAHYYRFAEIIERKQLIPDPATGDYAFTTPIEFDMSADVVAMAPVPPGGYTPANVTDAAVLHLVDGFTTAYSLLLDMLQAVWESDDGQAALWRAISQMFELEKYAKPLMAIPRPDGLGNYGPDFRYRATTQVPATVAARDGGN